MNIDTEKMEKKVLLYDESNQIIGEMYVDVRKAGLRSILYSSTVASSSSRVMGNSRYKSSEPNPESDTVPIVNGGFGSGIHTSRINFSTEPHLF